MKRHITKMSGPQYLLIASIIRKIEDPAVRQACADHFGTEFNKRSPVFDPGSWHSATGGNVAPNSAYRQGQRT